MSFSACASSALVTIAPKVPTPSDSAVGAVIVPTLDYTSTANNVYIDAFTAINLPSGVWLLSGILEYTATAGNLTSLIANVRINASSVGEVASFAVGVPTQPLVISMVIPVDASAGPQTLDVPVSASTSGGANWQLVSGVNSVLRLVRIA